ncbi:cecropin-B type 2-like [Anopheles albimanus]|uniref:Uncharacterized protein n=1 Tax=Anopheles albimanus TaxID=7167 RepID=A0A182FFU3_ANOAL|nr:cecropin-B type 2-like [Anopheles albimanus]
MNLTKLFVVLTLVAAVLFSGQAEAGHVEKFVKKPGKVEKQKFKVKESIKQTQNIKRVIKFNGKEHRATQ